MRFRILITPEAVAELQQAVDYYESVQEGLGMRFLDGYELQLTLLSANPFTHSVRYGQVRFARLHPFPYAIHYTAETADSTVLVVGIASHWQDPQTSWKQLD